MIGYHKHNWKLLDKEVIPSPFSLAAHRLTSVKRVGSGFFKTTVIYLVQCDCGKIRTLKESNY